jgi:glucokinase
VKNPNHLSAKDVFDLAKDGDELCVAVVDYVSKYLAYACHIFSVTTNPEVIVIGGGVSKAGDFLIDHIKKHFRKYKFMAVQDTIITLAELGNDAGMYGAASLIIND